MTRFSVITKQNTIIGISIWVVSTQASFLISDYTSKLKVIRRKFYSKFVFNWRITALQCCIGFCSIM